ncbi:MAG: hypothetical protein NT069_31020 [Planctomycetota bacterium]|nr:hypothetical protein [Planctomycetota bacterium]
MAIAASPRTVESAQEFPTVSPLRMLLVCGSALLVGYGVVLGYETVRYEEFTGYLQATSQLIVAGREATLETLRVAPGDEVATGRPLADLTDALLERRVREQRHDVETRERELARMEAERDSRIEQELLEIDDRIFDARIRAAELSRKSRASGYEPFASERWPDLALPGDHYPWWNDDPKPLKFDVRDANLVRQMLNEVPAAPQEKRVGQEVVDKEAADRFCSERIEDLEQRKRDLPAKISRSMRIDAEQARLDFAKRELALLEAEQALLTVRASVPGRVGVFFKQAGERVLPQETLVQVFDEERPFLVLQIPSSRVADFVPGTELELRFPGGRSGSGRVTEIPPQTTGATHDGGQRGATYVDVHVAPQGALWPELPFGSQVTVRRAR